MKMALQNGEVVKVVEELVRSLVDRPMAVEVKALDGMQMTVVEVRTARGDHGKVLGRKGRTIGAIRELLVGFSGAQKRRFTLEMVEPDGTSAPVVERKHGTINRASSRFEDDPVRATEALLTRLVRLLVDAEDCVSVTSLEGRQTVVFEVSADQADINRIIGIRGVRADGIQTTGERRGFLAPIPGVDPDQEGRVLIPVTPNPPATKK